MLCCSAQTAGIWESPEQSLIKAEKILSNASRAGAKLVAFPEQYAAGWDPASAKNIEGIDGTTVTGLKKLARKYSVTVIGSFRESFDPKPRNTVVAIGCDGKILATYAKIHLFSHSHEDDHFTAGTSLGIFSLEGISFGLAICYDLRFPELFQVYREKGVHAVIVPAAWPKNRLKCWELFIQSRAAENQIYVAGVNTTGSNPVDEYAGASMTADPRGVIIARAGEADELLFYDIEPGVAEHTRRSFPVYNDRNNPLYAKLRREQPK